MTHDTDGVSQQQSSVIDINSQVLSKLYVPVLKAVTSYWVGVIPHSCFLILLFVIERTLRFNKTREYIPYRHFLDGVYKKDGELIQAKVQLCKRTLPASIRWLEKQGLIHVSRVIEDSVRCINLFEIDFKRVLSREIIMLKVPKHPRKIPLTKNYTLGKRDTRGRAIGTQGYGNRDTMNIQKDKEPQKDNRLKGRDEKPSRQVEHIVEEITARTHLKRAEKAGRVSSIMTMTSVNALWQQVMVENFPGVPTLSFTPKEFAIFKNNAEVCLRNVDLRAFFEWLIPAWVTLRGYDLSWLNKTGEKMPLAPDVACVARYLRAFTKTYASHVMMEEKRKVYVRKIDAERQSPEYLSKQLEQMRKELAAQKKATVDAEAKYERLRLPPLSSYTKPVPPMEERKPLSSRRLKAIENIINSDESLGKWK